MATDSEGVEYEPFVKHHPWHAEQLDRERSEIDKLIADLTHEQHARCAYLTREGDGRACDCKYGLGTLIQEPRGEMTGCPELRTAIKTLKAIWRRP